MLSGRHYCFIDIFARSALLLLGIWSHALGVFGCKLQYERAGETIVLSPGPISGKLSMAYWKFNQIKVADINGDIRGHQFSGRVSLDQKNYSLTIQNLRITDSGNFTFVSAGENAQRPTSCSWLMIQEALTQSPTLDVINTTEVSNDFCEVWIKCSSRSDKDVSYRWTVNKLKENGSTLQYRLKQHGGDTTFTCTVSNMVSEVSGSESINCQSSPSSQTQELKTLFIIAGVACVVFVFIVGLVICCWCKRKHTAEATDELTVYAEIEDVTSSKIMKPCSVYETLENKTTAVTPKAQTVYDQIQFNRVQQPQNR